MNETTHLPDWWDDANRDLNDGCDDWYRCYWYYLCVVYGIVGAVALIQLLRIQRRVPDYGWTTQKVFILFNFVICLLRALTFGFYSYLDDLEDAIDSSTVQFFIFDIASLLFFTTYALLVLLWAEIYHQALGTYTHMIRRYFILANLVVYSIQALLWLLTIPDETENVARYISAGWLTCVFVAAVTGFLIYGGLLFLMLRKFPIDVRGRKRKLQEVGVITSVCSVCFLARSALIFMYILDKDDFDLDLMEDELLNIVFYLLCEVVPAICVLIVLRRLPPKRTKDSYDPTPESVPLRDDV